MKELILLVGPQGTGKTTYCKEQLPEYFRISQDDMGKTQHRMEFTEAVRRGEPKIVVDRINHTKQQREWYLNLAKQHGYMTRVIVMNRKYKTCLQRIMKREDHPTLKNNNKHAAMSALSMYFKEYQRVQLSEADVVRYQYPYDPFMLDISHCDRILVIGDLHGCYDEFMELIAKVEDDPHCAIVIAGDLCDRGPKIKEVFDFCMNDTRVFSVKGNHDDKLLRYLKGNKVKIGDGLQETIDQCGLQDINSEYAQELRMWLESLPLVIKWNDNYVMHAGIRPDLPMVKQNREYLLYARTYNPKTYSFTDPSAKPWFEYYAGEDKLFFGHQGYKKMQVHDKVYALDGGCVFGHELRGALLEGNSVTPLVVKAKKTYYEDRHSEEEMNDRFSNFERLVQEGYLRKSENDDLVLYGYTDKCTFDRHWNETTKQARGIIFDKKTGECVAKPFPKFFNLGEMPETTFGNLPNERYEVFEKMDGSLGIIYNYKGQWNVATRGSLESEQAKRAQQILQKYRIAGMVNEFVTLLVEIIYPENRIIVDYGNAEELCLLGAYNRENGQEYAWFEVEAISEATGMPLARQFNYTIEEMIKLQKMIPQDEEGFVVRFKSGLRVKIKGEEYLRIAKIMSHLSPLSLWETMENGKVKVEYLQQLPEELRKDFEPIVKKLEQNYNEVAKQIRQEADSFADKNFNGVIARSDETWKKMLGLAIQAGEYNHGGALFPYINGKTEAVDKYILKQIRPTGNVL